MFDFLFSFYGYVIFFYATTITIIYIGLAILGYFNILRNRVKYTKREEQILIDYPETAPGISIVAPAFNEEVIIVDSVNSLLSLEYPTYEIIIVNDGSEDSTLDLLVSRFDLIEVPYAYLEKVACKPFKRIFKSTNPLYEKLIVVDKVNGGTKADAMNAGVNVAKYDYFINTDVDCILASDTLTKVILPVLDSDVPVIAVGATMRMANGCEYRDGKITRVRPPADFVPTFQETEYLRSYLVAKMGWSALNTIPNVSGGFGLFEKNTVIACGGFDTKSHAEDMDMTLRLIAHKRENKLPYKIVQVPHSLCWTEGPPNLKVLARQRTRWGRGLLQIFFVHRKFLFNRKYGRMGWVIMPYAFFFELLAPIIEISGFLFLLFQLYTEQINFNTFWLMLAYVYLIGISISTITIMFDISINKLYRNLNEYMRLVLFSAFEAMMYHPFVVIFTIRGYFQFLTKKSFKWGNMTRQGFNSPKDPINTTSKAA
ncbi:glycosyltransferase family 2 protein [Sphingobacterium kyonggiense]